MTQRTSLTFGALLLPVIAGLSATVSAQGFGGFSNRVDSFAPLASFSLPSGVAEIVDVTSDGRTLVATNAGDSELVFIDIETPDQPTLIASLPVSGEPTSVSVAGDYAFATVWVDLPQEGNPPPAFLPGRLVVFDLTDPANPSVRGSVEIGYHPDSVKVRQIGNQFFAVIAVENEPVVVENGVVTDDEDPGNPNDVSPPGFIQVVKVNVQYVSDSTVIDVQLPPATMSAAGAYYPNDPQPEFVTWVGDTAAVSLQENNAIAIVNMQDPNVPTLTRVFELGVVDPRPADLVEDDDIIFTDTYPTDAPPVIDGGGNQIPAGLRFPDAIALSPDGQRIFSADEGELNFTGGRGFSWWDLDGSFGGDDGGFLESLSVVLSHYPEGRSENKGIEIEGAASARFGNRDFVFLSSERGSYLSVWRLDNQNRPRFVQLLPTGISPEGIVAIPNRKLLVTADEESGTITLFRGKRGRFRPSWRQPTIYSADFETPWAALSGMCSGFWPLQFFAVPDNALPTRIFAIQAGFSYAPIYQVTPVTMNGVEMRYDGEGICRDNSIVPPAHRGWWIASEGNSSSRPNLVVQVDRNGEVIREIQLPFAIDAAADPSLGGNATPSATGGKIRGNGFEGLCVSRNGRYLFAAIQREFQGENPTGPKFTRIARYDLQQIQNNTAPSNGVRTGGDWEFFFYQLDSNDPVNWAGLSEITCLNNGDLLVIERNQGIGIEATLKRLYRFSLQGLTPDTDGAPDASDTVNKNLVRDVLADFAPYEKIEGIVVGWFGDLWVGMDNDGGELESRLKFFGWL